LHPIVNVNKREGVRKRGRKTKMEGGLYDIGKALPLHLFLFLTPLSHFRYPGLVRVKLPKE
jgi:hypothetical protein